jgi:hypothetical protein
LALLALFDCNLRSTERRNGVLARARVGFTQDTAANGSDRIDPTRRRQAGLMIN